MRSAHPGVADSVGEGAQLCIVAPRSQRVTLKSRVQHGFRFGGGGFVGDEISGYALPPPRNQILATPLPRFFLVTSLL